MLTKGKTGLVNSVLAITLLAFASTAATASETLLTLENTKTETIIELSEEDLLAFEQHEIKTENDFIDGMVTFSGPLARDVVSMLEGEFESVKLSAVNDYSVDVPFLDYLNYDVIFVMSQDGNKLSRRDKGPIWVVYPMSDHSELQFPIYNDRMIWQLVRVTVE